MEKLYVCPCCSGQGIVHDLHGGEDQLYECLECDSTGRVTKAHRDELQHWQGRCRLRPLARNRANSRAPSP